MTAPQTSSTQMTTPDGRRRSDATLARWTLVLLKNNGETRILSAYKGLLFSVGLIVAVALAAVGYGWTVVANARLESRELAYRLTAEQKESASLRKANATLSAQAIEAQKQTEALSEALKAARDIPPVPMKNPVIAASPPPAVEQTAAQPAAAAAPEPAPEPPAAAASTVAVSDFSTDTASSGDGIRGRFKISNSQGRNTPVSGYIFVVLENASGQAATFPVDSFADGKPVSLKKGRYFSISKFKTVKFRVGPLSGTDPGQFVNAAVHVYGADGTLLRQQVFALGQSE